MCSHGERMQCFQVFCVELCLEKVQVKTCTRVEIKSPSVKTKKPGIVKICVEFIMKCQI